MISVADARQRILARLKPVPAEMVSLNEAWGRVLAADIVARRTQPPFAAAAMDGYAVRSGDLSDDDKRLNCVGSSLAGKSFQGSIGVGEAVRIFTGALVPAGADTVVIQEDTSVEGTSILVNKTVATGANIRPAGIDFTVGSVGLRRGRQLTARDISLAGAMNHPWLAVHRQPRIAILATGDELVMPGEPMAVDQIIGSNGPALAGLVRACGAVPVLLPIVGDSPAALLDAMQGAEGCDLLVTIGGASEGDYDVVRNVIGQAGTHLDFWKIAMRPGKPLLFGAMGDLPILGLPGNPVSALITALLFLRPAIQILSGIATPPEEIETAMTTIALEANGVREHYLRATLNQGDDGVRRATPVRSQDSSLTSALAAADCLIIRPAHAELAESGTIVPIIPLRLF